MENTREKCQYDCMCPTCSLRSQGISEENVKKSYFIGVKVKAAENALSFVYHNHALEIMQYRMILHTEMYKHRVLLGDAFYDQVDTILDKAFDVVFNKGVYVKNVRIFWKRYNDELSGSN
jgi:hypothetical protein